jgi:hypothetical protein
LRLVSAHSLTRSSPKGDQQHEQRRGLRRFLTWSFFLAEIGGAELAVNGPARAQDDDLEFLMRPLSPDVSIALLREEHFSPKFADNQSSEQVSSGSVSIAPFLPNRMPDDFWDRSHPRNDTPLPEIGGGARVGGGGGGSGGGGGGGGGTGRGSSGGTQLEIHRPLDAKFDPTLSIQIALANTHEPLIGLELNISGLLGFELDIDPAGLIKGIGLDLQTLEIIEDGGVSDIVSALRADLTHLLTETLPGLGQVLGSAAKLDLANLTGLLVAPIDLASPPSRHSDSPAAAPVSPFIAMAPLDNPSPPPLGPLYRANDTIIVPPQSTEEPFNQLYSLGKYTEYNISLQSTPDIGDIDSIPSTGGIDVPANLYELQDMDSLHR